MLTVNGIQIDEFTNGYLGCALWSSTDDNDTPLDSGHTVDDLAPDAIAKAVEDCERFQRENASLLETAYGEYAHYGNHHGTAESRAGHDFWLTRNGHGAGFWDGDLPKSGDSLTAAAKQYGESSPYVGDDGLIYL
jgi:hypothetical protein